MGAGTGRHRNAVLSLALATAAAAVFAAAAAMQHAVTRSAAVATASRGGADPLPVLRLGARLLGSPLWLAGLAANVLGFVLHAGALRTGDLSVVQAVLVLQLLFALPLSTVRTRGHLLGRDWYGTAIVCAGIGVLVVARAGRSQSVAPHAAAAVGALGGLGMVLLVVAARLTRHRAVRTALMGVAAGTGFSLTATFVVLISRQIQDRGLPAALFGWPSVAILLSGLTAAVLVQEAYASGSFPAALTAMTVADPLASWLWGALFFDTDAGATTVAWFVTSGLLILAGVAILANSPTLRDEG